MAKEKYDFGEKIKEYDVQTKSEIDVWQSPKYKESKNKAIEMIEDGRYNLSTADFWILMNRTKTGKMAYTGLIISHNGCLKINDAIENKVNPNCFSLDKEGYKNSLVYTYVDDDVYEVGEFNTDNGKNAYPYAMAFKRCFDRVVLKKSKLAYSGIYSEVEADEFKQDIDETKKEDKKEIAKKQENKEDKKEIMIQEIQKDKIKELYSDDEILSRLKKLNKSKLSNLTMIEASDFIKEKMEEK